VPRNATEAFNFFHVTAEQGELSAQNNLGVMYYDGEGTARNFPEALKWFSQAANRGIVNA